MNSFAFHALLAPQSMALAAFLVGAEVWLAHAHMDAFRPLLAARIELARASAAPRGGEAGAVA